MELMQVDFLTLVLVSYTCIAYIPEQLYTDMFPQSISSM